MRPCFRSQLCKIVMVCLMSLFANGWTSYAGTDNLPFDGKHEEISEILERHGRHENLPGVAIVAVKSREVLYAEEYGVTDLQTQKPVTSNTLFDLGTNGEVILMSVLMQLEEEGALSLTDPVSDYLPWIKSGPEKRQPDVTIEQLLNYDIRIPLPSHDGWTNIEDKIKAGLVMEPEHSPDPAHLAASVNYDILLLLIEKVTGKPLERYLREDYRSPFLPGSVSILRPETMEEQVAGGHKSGLFGLKTVRHDPNLSLGSGIAASSAGLGSWLLDELPRLKTYGFDQATDGSGSVVFVFNWMRHAETGEWYRTGVGTATSSFFLLNPDEEWGIAVLANRSTGAVEIIAREAAAALGWAELHDGEQNGFYASLQKLSNQALAVLVLALLYLGVTLFMLWETVRQIATKTRMYVGFTVRILAGLGGSVAYMGLLTFGLAYMLKHIHFNGFGLSQLAVIGPEQLKYAGYAVAASLLLSYLYFLLIYLFREQDNKNYFLLVVLSIAGGFGNAGVLYTINHALKNLHAPASKYLVYFLLGLTTFFISQQLVRRNLIQMTFDTVFRKRVQLIQIISRASFQKLEAVERGKINATLNNDTEVISRFNNLLVNFITNLITLTFCFTYLSIINLYGFLFILSLVLIAGLLYYTVGKKTRAIWERNRDIQSTFFNYIHDLLNGFKELYLNRSKRKAFTEDMIQVCNEYRNTRVSGEYRFITVNSLSSVMFMICLGVIVFSIPLIVPEFKGNDLVDFVFIFLYMTSPINAVLNAIPSIIQFRISWNRINKTISELEGSFSVDGEADPSGLASSPSELRLEGIRFAYDPEQEDSFSVGPIDFTFRTGEVTFIIGGNGSGKSTLAKLITGLYSPTEGLIRLNGNIVDSKQLTDCFSAVYSDFHLFNKLYGLDIRGKEELVAQYLWLLKLDHKVQIVGDRFSTTQLSTGQRKRLALLVALLEDKPFFLFDEWAADQDPYFRHFFYTEIIPELKARRKGIIAITHDDRYFHCADNVIRMDRGRFEVLGADQSTAISSVLNASTIHSALGG